MENRNVLILGASGQIAKHTIQYLQKDQHLTLTLMARNTNTLRGFQNPNTTLVEGDVLHQNELNKAVQGQNVVYANLAGAVDRMAKSIVEAMKKHGAKRLIFVTSLGIYDEIPGAFGEWNRKMIGAELVRYRKAADIIESSDLDYTIVRPAWLTDNDEVDYELTQKEEDFKGTEVSRRSVGAYIAEVIQHPERDVKASVGINKPNTDGDKPAFY